ncbi:hypothetical protein UJ101_01009 [Flavobacteriaceae bacterium UJ101]|nr:hypothetical protein UJ101_01009 [Flavobacteriaceae bacterium UJ101]
MTVRYFIIKTSKAEYVSIYVRFLGHDRYDERTVTGLKIKKDQWSVKDQKVKPKSIVPQREFINNHLIHLKSHLYDAYNVTYNSKSYIKKNWLKDEVNKYFGRAKKDETYKIYFTDWVGKFIQDSHKRLKKDGNGTISLSTQKYYKTVYNKLIQYEKYKKIKLRFEDINLKFYEDIVFYLREDQKLNNNTIGGTINKIKLFCKQIELQGLPINIQYKEFKAPSNKTFDTYLNEDEINKIFHYDFSKQPSLDNARDLFIIGLWTGLRISDFMRLKDLNINEEFIEITTQKNDEPVIIPMHKQIKSILKKYNDDLPYKISDQKFNKHIKRICKIVGIDQKIKGSKMNSITKRKEVGIYHKYELIASHACRRSFASNLYGKLPNMVIMSITTHKTEAQFLKYIKITKQEHANTLKEFWAKQKEENKYESVTMKIVK